MILMTPEDHGGKTLVDPVSVIGCAARISSIVLGICVSIIPFADHPRLVGIEKSMPFTT
jgi:hypothetical protein